MGAALDSRHLLFFFFLFIAWPLIPSFVIVILTFRISYRSILRVRKQSWPWLFIDGGSEGYFFSSGSREETDRYRRLIVRLLLRRARLVAQKWPLFLKAQGVFFSLSLEMVGRSPVHVAHHRGYFSVLGRAVNGMNHGNFRYLETMVICYRLFERLPVWRTSKNKGEESSVRVFWGEESEMENLIRKSEIAMTRNLNNLAPVDVSSSL